LPPLLSQKLSSVSIIFLPKLGIRKDFLCCLDILLALLGYLSSVRIIRRPFLLALEGARIVCFGFVLEGVLYSISRCVSFDIQDDVIVFSVVYFELWIGSRRLRGEMRSRFRKRITWKRSGR